ncbi:hypothetical protein [Micromonospora sp. NBC_01638]|uniref:hypothetical protein n=1 Tax=Micromonospora sp. NBC_01638 TaxID=2975982 RepID=UPI00386A14D8|nr:hypothetical protein OG811_24260 [Micromonospora sp. NBC_01638]
MLADGMAPDAHQQIRTGLREFGLDPVAAAQAVSVAVEQSDAVEVDLRRRVAVAAIHHVDRDGDDRAHRDGQLRRQRDGRQRRHGLRRRRRDVHVELTTPGIARTALAAAVTVFAQREPPDH